MKGNKGVETWKNLNETKIGNTRTSGKKIQPDLDTRPVVNSRLEVRRSEWKNISPVQGVKDRPALWIRWIH